MAPLDSGWGAGYGNAQSLGYDRKSGRRRDNSLSFHPLCPHPSMCLAPVLGAIEDWGLPHRGSSKAALRRDQS